jgi:hypothetical protein
MLNPRIKEQLLEVATHPLIIKAIKDVYSLRGVGHRKGEFDRKLAIGMLKNAVNIIKKEGNVNQEAFGEKIIEWLQKSGDRGKGAIVHNLDDILSELLFDINKKHGQEKEEEPINITKERPSDDESEEPEETTTGDIPMPKDNVKPQTKPVDIQPVDNKGDDIKPLTEEALENIINVNVYVDPDVDMSKVKALASSLEASLSQAHTTDGILNFSMRKPNIDPDSKYLNPYEAFKQGLLKIKGVKKVEADLVHIDEEVAAGGAGVASVAGAGCLDGTVSQAATGQQGVAIRPSRMGLGLKGMERRKIEEETGCPDFSKMYAFNRTEEETEDRREENGDRRESFLKNMRARIQSLLEDIDGLSKKDDVEDVELVSELFDYEAKQVSKLSHKDIYSKLKGQFKNKTDEELKEIALYIFKILNQHSLVDLNEGIDDWDTEGEEFVDDEPSASESERDAQMIRSLDRQPKRTQISKGLKDKEQAITLPELNKIYKTPGYFAIIKQFLNKHFPEYYKELRDYADKFTEEVDDPNEYDKEWLKNFIGFDREITKGV